MRRWLSAVVTGEGVHQGVRVGVHLIHHVHHILHFLELLELLELLKSVQHFHLARVNLVWICHVLRTHGLGLTLPGVHEGRNLVGVASRGALGKGGGGGNLIKEIARV